MNTTPIGRKTWIETDAAEVVEEKEEKESEGQLESLNLTEVTQASYTNGCGIRIMIIFPLSTFLFERKLRGLVSRRARCLDARTASASAASAASDSAV